MTPLFLSLLLAAPMPAPFLPQSPPPANSVKPAPSVAGRWAMTVDLENPNSSSTLEITLEGNKVSGTIVGANTFAIIGEYVDGKLTFSLQYNEQTRVSFAGQLKEDGTLGGTMEYGEGPVTWRAKRQ
jgi:hypothetical protein